MLFALFGIAVVCALGAIVAFTTEMLMAGTGIRAEVAKSRRSVSQDDAAEAQEGQQGGGEAHETAAPSDNA